MRAFVTGATGFIGSHLCEELHRQGWEVTCGLRRSSNPQWLRGKPYRSVELDYGSVPSIARAAGGSTHVFHVAGVIMAGDRRRFLQGNWEITRNLVQALLGRTQRIERLVHFSSLAAAGPSRDGVRVDESTPCAPVSWYGRSKLLGEREVLAVRDRLPVTVIRPPMVYGPRDPGLKLVYDLVRRGFVPRIAGRRLMSFVSVHDLVRAAARAATEPGARGEVYLVSDERVLSYAFFIRSIAKALGSRIRWVTLPPQAVRGLMSGIGSILRGLGIPSMINDDKAAEVLQSQWICTGRKFAEQFRMPTQVPFEEGLRETIRWYVEQKWLG